PAPALSMPSEGSMRAYVHGHDEPAPADDAYAPEPAGAAPAEARGMEAAEGIETKSEESADGGSADAPGKLKAGFAKGAAKGTPAIASWAKHAKIAAAVLAARVKRSGGETDVEIAPRRTTAPPPGGGLHASGRKVVRGSVPDFGPMDEEPVAPNRFAL